jgi:hypothetical protein
MKIKHCKVLCINVCNSINNKLQQPEAAAGVLKYTLKNQPDIVSLKF